MQHPWCSLFHVDGPLLSLQQPARAIDEVNADQKYDDGSDKNVLTSYFKKVSELHAEEKAQVEAN